MGENRIDQLSATDIWLLLMSIYSHDIGMAIKYEDVYKFFVDNNCEDVLNDYASSKKRDVAEAAARLLHFGTISINNKYEQSIRHFNDMRLIIETHFRGLHAVKSKEYIDLLMESFNKYSIINIRIVRLLGDICIAHQKDTSYISSLPYKTNGLLGDYAHPRFIAGMLCMGDLLDLDTDRFNEGMLDIIDPLPESSKVHLLKHKAIKHFLVSSSEIEILSDTESEEVNRELKSWTQYLQDVVQYLCLNWDDIAPQDFGVPPRIKSIKHFKNGNENWSDYLSLAFTIDKNRAIELLQGANIYNNKFAFVREVIQNSIDASIMQMWYELHNNNPDEYNTNTKITEMKKEIFDNYPIDIELEIDKEGHCIFIIWDRGVGIDAYDLKNIAKVGDSNILKKKDILNSMPNWLKPSGAFGLGLQSIFMVTDSFEIVSKTDNDYPKTIKFESGNYNNGYISVSDYKGYFTRGTKVIIKIDSQKFNLYDFHYDTDLVLKFRTLDNLVANSIYNSMFRMSSYGRFAKKYEYSFFDINFRADRVGEKPLEEKISEKQLFDNILSSNETFNNAHDFKFTYYNHENNVLCRISLNNPFSKDDSSNIQLIRASHLYNHSIYFRNAHIKDYSSDHYFNKILYKYIDFEVNILNYKSAEMLKISRDSFSKEGKVKAQELIEIVIMKTLSLYIDKLLVSDIELDTYGICLLQICKLLNHREIEFKEKFLSGISKYKYGAFTSYAINKKPVDKNVKYNLSYTITDLLEKKHIVIVKSYSKNLLEESIFASLPEITDIDETIQNQDIIEYYSENVISNKIIAKSFMRYDDSIYECLIIEPLLISEYHLPTYDTVNKVNSYIKAIIDNHRTIDGQKDYEDLSVIEGDREHASYRIELPFAEDDFSFLKGQLYSRSENNFEREKFLKYIKESKYFKAVISFISEKKDKSEDIIKAQMLKLLNEMCELIFEDELFEKYVINAIYNPKNIIQEHQMLDN